MPGEIKAGTMISSGLSLMLKEVEAGAWNSAAQILYTLQHTDLPNHPEPERAAALQAKLPSLHAALHVKDMGAAADTVRAAIKTWEANKPAGSSFE